MTKVTKEKPVLLAKGVIPELQVQQEQLVQQVQLELKVFKV